MRFGGSCAMNTIVIVKVDQAVWIKRFSVSVMTIVAMCFGCRSTAAQMICDGATSQVATIRQDGAPRRSTEAPATQSPAQKYFTDVVLINQNGERMRFYSDLLQGKVVIINSFFATCEGSCLPMNRNLEKVQQVLGDRVGKDVHIISISVDPSVDTPASLKEYAKKLHAKPGWYFLTGDKQNVDYALNKLGQFVNNKQDHLNITIIGNESTGLWKKAFGLAPGNELVKVVESVLNDQPAGNK